MSGIPCGCMFPKLCEDCRGSGYIICYHCDEQPATHYADELPGFPAEWAKNAENGYPACDDCHPMPDRCSICERRLTTDTRSREPLLCKSCQDTARVAGAMEAQAARYPEGS